jgi:hypothetical protein
MVDFGSNIKAVTLIKYTKRPAKWQQSVSGITDGGTVQIVLPTGTNVVAGNFKVKARFFDTNNREQNEITYSINSTGLMTIYLPIPDTGAVAFSGKIFFTQRN